MTVVKDDMQVVSVTEEDARDRIEIGAAINSLHLISQSENKQRLVNCSGNVPFCPATEVVRQSPTGL